ncbi:MAG: DUF4058 family protein [Rhodopirellula sp.]|nr:DUF4058 family protein [Rhodopirellula sp.]
MNRANALLSRIEAAGWWAYFHKNWLLQVRSQLRPQLPPQYFVFVESETILVTPDAALPAKPVMPDIAVARPERDAATEAKAGSSRATAAVIKLEEPCELSSQYTLLIRRSPENMKTRSTPTRTVRPPWSRWAACGFRTRSAWRSARNSRGAVIGSNKAAARLPIPSCSGSTRPMAPFTRPAIQRQNATPRRSICRGNPR